MKDLIHAVAEDEGKQRRWSRISLKIREDWSDRIPADTESVMAAQGRACMVGRHSLHTPRMWLFGAVRPLLTIEMEHRHGPYHLFLEGKHSQESRVQKKKDFIKQHKKYLRKR